MSPWADLVWTQGKGRGFTCSDFPGVNPSRPQSNWEPGLSLTWLVGFLCLEQCQRRLRPESRRLPPTSEILEFFAPSESEVNSLERQSLRGRRRPEKGGGSSAESRPWYCGRESLPQLALGLPPYFLRAARLERGCTPAPISPPPRPSSLHARPQLARFLYADQPFWGLPFCW